MKETQEELQERKKLQHKRIAGAVILFDLVLLIFLIIEIILIVTKSLK